MQRKTLVKIGLSLLAVLLLSQAFTAVASAQWDFPRLDELLFRIKWPYTVSLEAAKACEIDTYIGAIRTLEVETLRNDPYYWSVTAAPGFHMCYIAINCRDVAPSTSGERVDYHGRTPGFQLYPLNLTAFRYALELIVGCNKTVWINDIYGYINVRLDTNVPPANVKWYNPDITPYPLDWDLAYEQLMAAGFTGTIGGQDWVMPNGQPMRMPIYAASPLGTPTSEEITRRHVKSWNAFFCGQEVADAPHGCYFIHEPRDFYEEIDIGFYQRDFDMFMLCWGLTRNPDYLWWFFHPDADQPDWNNAPGLDYRPLNAMIDAFFYCMYTEKTELRIRGPGPIVVAESDKYYTAYAFVAGSEEVYIAVYGGHGGYPYRTATLEAGVDYEIVYSAGLAVGIHFLQDISLDADMYLHIVYRLHAQVSINLESELIQVCRDIQWMLYYMCPYLTIYSRNYHDLYKPGLESWVPSLGYGSGAYQLKWTYGSIHWTGAPVGGSVQWHLPGPINTFHPWLATSVYEVTILNRLYDGLLTVDAYTHQDIPWMAEHYRIDDWTGPSGEPGMKITWWIRNDLTWQDGDHITADDFIWDYEFINSIQPAQLYAVWGYYHGCEKYNDYCFSVKVNTTGVWNFYAYTGGPTYPRKIWEPYYGNLAGAETFEPWNTPYTTQVPAEKRGPTPPPTCLYGTGEWIFDYYDVVLGIIRVFKNVNSWVNIAAKPCRQVGSMHAPTIANRLLNVTLNASITGPFVNELPIEWHCISPPWLFCTWWRLVDYVDWDLNGPDWCDTISFVILTGQGGVPVPGAQPLVGHIASYVVAGGTVTVTVSVNWPKITKTVVGLDILDLDTKESCTHTWYLTVDGTLSASGTQTLAPLAFRHWWQALAWQTLSPGPHTLKLEITNAYGTNYYTMYVYVLIGDVDNNNIVNMLDLYKTAIVFGATGPACWKAEDIDNNGVINMLDLYICAVKFGTTC